MIGKVLAQDCDGKPGFADVSGRDLTVLPPCFRGITPPLLLSTHSSRLRSLHGTQQARLNLSIIGSRKPGAPAAPWWGQPSGDKTRISRVPGLLERSGLVSSLILGAGPWTSPQSDGRHLPDRRRVADITYIRCQAGATVPGPRPLLMLHTS